MAVSYQHQGCPRCGHKVPLELLSWDTAVPCAVCNAVFQGESFPALHRERERGLRAETIADEQEASCFFHQENRAAQCCSACGRFICSLCTLELPTGVVCPDCFSDGRLIPKTAGPVLEKSRRIWSSAAGTLLILSFICFWPTTILTAPIAGGMAILGLRRPGSLTGHGRWKNYAVLLFALLLMLVWAWALATSYVWKWPK